jgi:predicted Zn-dependent protease with MMP-like domain
VAAHSYRLTPEEFDAVVEEALELIPAQFGEAMANVAVLVELEPPAGEEELLGVYDGVPLTDWGQDWGGNLPDRITLFQGSLERMCASHDELLDEIAVTVVHEVAHHFGIDDQRLHELGWG